jgi:ligand-binding sensor domain-containing protein
MKFHKKQTEYKIICSAILLPHAETRINTTALNKSGKAGYHFTILIPADYLQPAKYIRRVN